jgi:CheY-like chemotaxis protein
MRELLLTWGLDVDVALDPEDAMAMVRRDAGTYDLVLTDQTMPRMSGLQLAEAIARIAPASAVVLYTGYADNIDPRELRSAGVKALVRKPVEPLELRTVVAECLNAGRGASRLEP